MLSLREQSLGSIMTLADTDPKMDRENEENEFKNKIYYIMFVVGT